MRGEYYLGEFLHEEVLCDGGPVNLVLRLLDKAPELCQPGVNTLYDVRLALEITHHPLNLQEILRIVHTLIEMFHHLFEIRRCSAHPNVQLAKFPV